MVKYKIQGKTCSFMLNVPKYLDEKSKSVLTNIFSYCLDKESKDKVLNAVDALLSQTNGLIRSMKESNTHDKDVEKGIREFIGTHLKHGFDIGLYYTPREEGPEILDILSEQFDFGRIVGKLPKAKKPMSELVFYCMDLASLAIETGITLAYFLNEELVEQHQNELKKHTSYIQ